MVDQNYNHVVGALDDITQALDVDGYTLQVVGVAGGRLELEILARENACEECLVPKSIMLSMIEPKVRDRGFDQIDVKYPND